LAVNKIRVEFKNQFYTADDTFQFILRTYEYDSFHSWSSKSELLFPRSTDIWMWTIACFHLLQTRHKRTHRT